MPKAKKPAPVAPDLMNVAAQEQVRSYVRRAMNLEDDMDDLKADRAELYKEAKGMGYDPKVLRKVVARRRADQTELSEFEALLELYESATQGDLFAPADLKVSIEVPGAPPVQTTAAVMQKLADDLGVDKAKAKAGKEKVGA